MTFPIPFEDPEGKHVPSTSEAELVASSPALEVICQRIERAVQAQTSPLMTVEELMAKTGLRTPEAVVMWRKRERVPLVPGYRGCVSRAQVMPILERAANPRHLPRRAKLQRGPRKGRGPGRATEDPQ